MWRRVTDQLTGRACGVTLFELMVSLTIMVPLILVTTTAVIRSMRTYASMARAEEEDLLSERMHSLFTRAMSELDSHRLNIPPIIHHGGTIRFSDLTPYPISSNAALAPDRESDAITAVELLGHVAQRTTALLWSSGATAEVAACPPRVIPATVRSMIALGLEGISELRIEARKRLPSGCAHYLLTLGKSVSFPQSVSTEQALILIPVARHYTLYRDITKRLRYLAHAGSDTIENQPIINNAPQISLALGAAAQPPSSSLLQLRASLRFSAQRITTVFYTHMLGRRSLAVVTARELSRLDPSPLP